METVAFINIKGQKADMFFKKFRLDRKIGMCYTPLLRYSFENPLRNGKNLQVNPIEFPKNRRTFSEVFKHFARSPKIALRNPDFSSQNTMGQISEENENGEAE